MRIVIDTRGHNFSAAVTALEHLRKSGFSVKEIEGEDLIPWVWHYRILHNRWNTSKAYVLYAMEFPEHGKMIKVVEDA